LLSACTKKSPVPAPAPSNAPVASVVVPSAVIVDAAPPPSMCTTFDTDAKKRMASAIAKFPIEGDPPPPPNTLIGFCADTASGAWRIELPTSLTDVHDQSAAAVAMETSWEVAHVTRAGKEVRFAPPTLDRLTGYGGRMPQKPIVFDFDGDGELELYVEVREEGDEGHRQTENLFLRFAAGAITTYAPAKAFDIDTMRDVDADGRPDLVIFAHYSQALLSCGAGFPYEHAKPKFVAHALADGTFSTNDAAAKGHAKSWCPAAPRTIASSYDAICARLWATDVAAARAFVGKSCIVGTCGATGYLEPAGAAADCERRKAWVDKPPPLTLP
jgi:hypothetical protein